MFKKEHGFGLALVVVLAVFTQITLADHLDPPAIFEDGFESGDFSAWTSAGGNWDTVNNAGNAHSGSYRAEIKGGGEESDNTLLKEVSTEGKENLEFSFWFYVPSNKALEEGDTVTIEYTVGDGWNEFYTITNEDSVDTWINRSNGFGDEVNDNPDFAIRVVSNFNAPTSDAVRFDDFLLTGTNTEQEGPSIHAFKYWDKNGNGERDNYWTGEYIFDEEEEELVKVFAEEPPIAGWSMCLHKGEAGVLVSCQSTDQDGWIWWMDGITEDTYQVKEEMQSGWFQTEVSVEEGDGGVSVDYPAWAWLQVNDENREASVIFGNSKNALHILKYWDRNGNGERDGEWNDDTFEIEPVLGGWEFCLNRYDDETGDYLPYDDGACQKTDENGWVWWMDLEEGNYLVKETIKRGWSFVGVDGVGDFDLEEGDGDGDFFIDVEERNGEVLLAVGNEATVITGRKWLDSNHDGEWNGDAERALAGWTVALGRVGEAISGHGGPETIPIEIVAMTLTGADGSYVLPVAERGAYKVFEEKRGGWHATNPAPTVDSFFDITYDLDLIAKGDPDFDLLRSSFFDVFVEDMDMQEITTDIRDNPLNFGNFEEPVEESGDDDGGGGEPLPSPAQDLSECSDGLDNDDDGFIDRQDPACTSDLLDDESSDNDGGDGGNGGGSGGGGSPSIGTGDGGLSAPSIPLQGQVLGASTENLSVEEQIEVLKIEIERLKSLLLKALEKLIAELQAQLDALLQSN